MPDDDLDDIIKRTRRVLRAQSGNDEEQAIPPGFADRVVRAKGSSPVPSQLILWQRVSYIGVAVACAVAFTSVIIFREEAEIGSAADPWLNMPMSSLGEETDNEEGWPD